MSIHYVGTLSKRPGLLACRTRAAQATTDNWHSTDCTACKMTLIGMPVASRDNLAEAGNVADFDAVSVVIEAPAADVGSAPDTMRTSWDGFDHRWVRS